MAQHDYTVISRLCVSHYFTFVASMLHYFVRKSVYLRDVKLERITLTS